MKNGVRYIGFFDDVGCEMYCSITLKKPRNYNSLYNNYNSKQVKFVTYICVSGTDYMKSMGEVVTVCMQFWQTVSQLLQINADVEHGLGIC